MTKKKLPAKPWMFPKPAVLVGAMVRGRPNFNTIANCGIICYDPPMVSVSSDKSHYTNLGIRKQKTFSVNFPSAKMARLADFCGLYSGNKVDKSKVFKVFFGDLKTAPLIEECPVNLECKLVKTLRLGEDEVFVGKIIAIWADEKCMRDEKLAIKKIDPLIYSTADKKYYRVGKEIGRAYSIGKR
jgi:flavin reductase (DIM6/NTAB) family NADH-FMN oxidoreductase RutF